MDIPILATAWLNHFKSQNEELIKKIDVRGFFFSQYYVPTNFKIQVHKSTIFWLTALVVQSAVKPSLMAQLKFLKSFD